jgi:uncharacterized protein with gpF-like domain
LTAFTTTPPWSTTHPELGEHFRCRVGARNSDSTVKLLTALLDDQEHG